MNILRDDPHPLQEESEQHARRACGAERYFLSAMMNNPREAWDAAADAGIDWQSFADPRHSRLFDVICAAVLSNITPTPWIIGQELVRLGYPFDPAVFYVGGTESVEGIPTNEIIELWCLEQTSAGLSTWARQIKYYADRRSQARSLFQELHEVLGEIAA